MDQESIIEKYGPYYHITSTEVWEEIQKNGLKPIDPGIGYSSDPTKENPLICLTAEHKKDKWIEPLTEKLEAKKLHRIRVNADSIIKRNFSLDHTSSETEIYQRQKDDFEYILRRSGDIVCYDLIPFAEIINHELINVKK